MNDAEESYLAQFRTLAEKRARIIGMIAELRSICESLKDWEKTASEVATLGGNEIRPEWSDDRLRGLITLRALLCEYHALTQEIRRTWQRLKDSEKTGFSDPESLRS